MKRVSFILNICCILFASVMLTSCLAEVERIDSADDTESIESITDTSSEDSSDSENESETESESESESETNNEKTLVGIYASGAKTEYKFGEDFTADGIVVSKVYSDDSEEIISESEYIIDSSAFDKSIAGEYTIIIKSESNETVTCEFTVVVLPIEDEKDSSKWSDILWG